MHSFKALPEIWNCSPLKKLLPSGMQASLNPLQVPANPFPSCHHSHLWAKYNPGPPPLRQLLLVLRSNQTRYPRSKIIKVLRRVISIQLQWLLGAACLWKNPMSGTMMLSTDDVKEVGNMRIVPIQKTRALIVSVSWGMIMAGHLSMADMLSLDISTGCPHSKEHMTSQLK